MQPLLSNHHETLCCSPRVSPSSLGKKTNKKKNQLPNQSITTATLGQKERVPAEGGGWVPVTPWRPAPLPPAHHLHWPPSPLCCACSFCACGAGDSPPPRSRVVCCGGEEKGEEKVTSVPASAWHCHGQPKLCPRGDTALSSRVNGRQSRGTEGTTVPQEGFATFIWDDAILAWPSQGQVTQAAGGADFTAHAASAPGVGRQRTGQPAARGAAGW